MAIKHHYLYKVTTFHYLYISVLIYMHCVCITEKKSIDNQQSLSWLTSIGHYSLNRVCARSKCKYSVCFLHFKHVVQFLSAKYQFFMYNSLVFFFKFLPLSRELQKEAKSKRNIDKSNSAHNVNLCTYISHMLSDAVNASLKL